MQRLSSLPDTELIGQMKAGCESAFTVLLRRYEKDVRAVIVHYVKDRLLAEDLSQDAFVKIYTSLQRGRYCEQGKFLPWALRIVRNLCMDHLRKAAQLPPSGRLLHDDFICTSTQQNVDYKLTVKQQEQQLNAFINRLPDAQQKVVRYRFFEELSFREIAVLMNTSVNTSLGRMRYGLSHLRRQIDKAPACAWR